MNRSIKGTLEELRSRFQNLSETSYLDAEVLLAHILVKTRSWVIAHPGAFLEPEQQEYLNKAAARFEKGEPLPYIIGHWEFYGLDFQITPDVLIPRPETEILVERGLNWLSHQPQAHRVIDIGTGSGCIGIALAKNNPGLEVLLTDISKPALDIARANAERYGLKDRARFQKADLFEGIEGSFDLICANLPYIPRALLGKLDVARYEPRLALDGGETGTELIFRLLDQSVDHLDHGGLLLMEIEADQGEVVCAYARSLFPASQVRMLKDLTGTDRCLEIERPSWIVHICHKDDWVEAQERGVYTSKTLQLEGFIHCSTTDQVLGVANRFYRGEPGLILLWIDPEQLAEEIRWELADGMLFPHIYGPIDLKSVLKVTNLTPDRDGSYLTIATSP